MNPKKTEFIWFGSHANLENLAARTGTSSLTVTRDVVQCANTVCDLGVTLDTELSTQSHISKVTQTCFYHIRRLKQVRNLLGPDVAAKLVVSHCVYQTGLLQCNISRPPEVDYSTAAAGPECCSPISRASGSI